MLTLFRINAQKKILLDKEAIKLVPELKNLKQDQILYLILAYDYNSKYHQWPEEERKRKACHEVYGTTEKDPESSKLMRKAIDGYIGLQYNQKVETIKAYTNKMRRLDLDLDEAATAKEISDIIRAKQHLNSAIKELERDLDQEYEHIELRGDGNLSLIERCHMMGNNLKEYISLKRREKVPDVKE